MGGILKLLALSVTDTVGRCRPLGEKMLSARKQISANVIWVDQVHRAVFIRVDEGGSCVPVFVRRVRMHDLGVGQWPLQDTILCPRERILPDGVGPGKVGIRSESPLVLNRGPAALREAIVEG